MSDPHAEGDRDKLTLEEEQAILAEAPLDPNLEREERAAEAADVRAVLGIEEE